MEYLLDAGKCDGERSARQRKDTRGLEMGRELGHCQGRGHHVTGDGGNVVFFDSLEEAGTLTGGKIIQYGNEGCRFVRRWHDIEVEGRSILRSIQHLNK